jgi:hypothetical protein
LLQRSQGVDGHTGIELTVGREQGRIDGMTFFDGEKFGVGIQHGVGSGAVQTSPIGDGLRRYWERL